MARTIDHLNRVSESFDQLTQDEKQDIVAELYTRLYPRQASNTMKLIEFWNRVELRKCFVSNENGNPPAEETPELPFDTEGTE